MEPITTLVVLGYLANLGAGVGAQESAIWFKRALSNRTQRRRIAKTTSKAALEEGIRVKPAVLREWLSRSDVQDQLLLGSHASVETAIHRLAWVLTGSEQTRNGTALRLVEIVCQQYLLAQSSQKAVVASAAQTQALVVADGSATRDELKQGIAQIIDKLDDSAVFDEDLRRLHVWRASEAKGLAATWRGIREVVHLLARSRHRGTLIEGWAAAPPGLLEDAPGMGLCWLGQVAADYGRPSAAVTFMLLGIERGVSDPDYWFARAALVTPAEGESGELARRNLLERAQTPHPLGRALLAMLDRQWNAGETALESWDAAPGLGRAVKALLRAECARAQGELDLAISILEEGCTDEPEASGPTLHLAELLLSRGYRGHTVSRIADFTKAQALAVRARDSRRQWSGDSVAAVLVAIKASALAGDVNRTWQLTLVVPEGEATPDEAADVRLRQEAAILAATMTRNAAAGERAAELDDPYTSAVVAGYEALDRGDVDLAEEHWMQAWTHASDDFTRLQVARSLAPLGMRLPPLEDLSIGQPDMVDEIRAIHNVMAAASGERLAKLRAHAHEYEQIAVLLAQELSALDEYLQAGEVLEEAARRWGLPLLMKMAADRYAHAGEYERAVGASRSASTMAGDNWPGEAECLQIEFNALEALGREGESILVVRRMVELAPDNDAARWALVNCLGRQGNLEAAFAALRHNGRPIRPRDREDARNWIVLLTQADQSPYYLPRVLDEFDRWRDDEEIAGVFLANIMLGLTRRETDLDEAQLTRLHASTDDYAERFPDSAVLRRFTVSEDDPLGDLSEILKARQTDPEILDLQEGIATAQLPLGLAAELHKIPYAEASMKRAAGFAYSHVSDDFAGALDELLSTIGTGPAVLDTTAGVTLLALDHDLRERLLGRFSRLDSTGTIYRDARAAQQSLALRSTMSLGWDSRLGRPRLAEISPEQADALAERANGLVGLLSGTRRREWQPQYFAELDGAWINALDYAVSSEAPFWCDDLVLRNLARQAGCMTFGTIDLIRALEVAGELTADHARFAQATLLTEFHALLPFDADLYESAAEFDDWRPGGACAVLTLPDLWRSPAEVMDFVHTAARHNVDDRDEELHGWVAAAAVGLVKLGGEPVGASRNLALLLGSFLARPWMTPALLPVVVDAVRQAISGQEGIVDPLHEALVLIHRIATGEFNESAASYVLLHWAQHLKQSDKHDATMIAANRA